MNYPLEIIEGELAEIHVKKRKFLKDIFKGKIKGSFLVEILERVTNKLERRVFELFNFGISQRDFITGDFDCVDYEICRHIVGIHRANMVFVEENERREKENSEIYKQHLTEQVVYNIEIRNYASVFFRKKTFWNGDEFLFFPVPCQMFAMCVMLLKKINETSIYYKMYADILKKTLAALSLLGDNFLDSAYPVCRGIIELYLKLRMLKIYPCALQEHEKFVNWEIDRNCCQGKYSKEFLKRYYGRKNSEEKNKINYLHYGWLDIIAEYINSEIHKKYSAQALAEYLAKKSIGETRKNYEQLSVFYKMCHAYVHGNVGTIKYPLLHYFEISLMIYPVVTSIFQMIQEESNLDDTSCNFDARILKELDKNMKLMCGQYERRSTKLFEEYYR